MGIGRAILRALYGPMNRPMDGPLPWDRGIGGGGASAFNPLADADLVGLWLPADTSDNGTALTWTNTKPGGASLVATGVGRPTIVTTLYGSKRGVSINGSAIPLRGAATLVGKTASTIIVLYQDSAPVSLGMYLIQYGQNGNQSLYVTTNDDGSGSMGSNRLDDLGTRMASSRSVNNGPIYPRVFTYRTDDLRASGDQVLPVRTGNINGETTYSGPPAITGTFVDGLLVLGSANSVFPVAGTFGAAAMLSRCLTDVEVAQWVAYLMTQCGYPVDVDVVFMGDSITVGADSLWRQGVQSLCDARTGGPGFYRACGPFQSGAYTNRCWANSGLTIATLRADFDYYGLGTRYFPDILPVMIGINDIIGGASAATVATRYADLLTDLRTRCPNAAIYAQALLPVSAGYAAYNSIVTDFVTNHLPGLCSSAGVTLDSTLRALSLGGGISYSDGLHPDAAAGPAMSAAMYAKVCEWSGVSA